MDRDTEGKAPKMEDYGSSDSGSGGVSDRNKSDLQGKYSGGTEGTQGSGEGEKFGEFDNTGTDLTVEMENTDARSGLVKGGEEGASDAGGPGRYGGTTGGVNDGNSSSSADHTNEGSS